MARLLSNIRVRSMVVYFDLCKTEVMSFLSSLPFTAVYDDFISTLYHIYTITHRFTALTGIFQFFLLLSCAHLGKLCLCVSSLVSDKF